MPDYRIETFEDIVRALRENPEWLEEMRRLILTDEILSFPKKFEKFVRDDFNSLVIRVDRIESDVSILKQDVAILKQDVAILKQDVAILKQDVAVLKQDVADLKGDNFERKVREKAPSYFGKLIKKCKVISIEELAQILDNAVEKGVITEEERNDALRGDIVVKGLLKQENKEVIIVGEVSIKIDKNDVERAYNRTSVVGKATGISSVGVVIGKETTEEATQKAEELGVILV